jgi:hypothetical protein
MPAGLGRVCETCYWENTFQKRQLINKAAFSQSNIATAFLYYGEWLKSVAGVRKAALSINRHLIFFLDIERNWKSIPDYETLLTHFGAGYLRRALLPMRWFEITGYIVSNKKIKEDISTKRRIQEKLVFFPNNSQERNIIHDYYQSLVRDMSKGQIGLRTINLALTPALALMKKANEMKYTIPSQKVLNEYIEMVPGQYASISRFIRFLNIEKYMDIYLPKIDKNKAEIYRKNKLEKILAKLIQTPNKYSKFRQRWISISLAYFHGLSKNIMGSLNEENIKIVQDGILIIWNNQQFWIPPYPTTHSPPA